MIEEAMATIEPRVNIALDSTTLSTIKQIANQTKQSVSKICADLIRKQIEHDEDAYYIGLIRQMGNVDKKPRISSQEMQKRLDELQD
ncbi:MAG: hypothetical protein LBD32_00760 [Cytophagales bacterium]|jgi:hypothetical protein|nr:hypothetical protein [Cytophagales bacterium]